MADLTLTVADLIGILKAHERAWGALIVTELERRAILAALERAQRLEEAAEAVRADLEADRGYYVIRVHMGNRLVAALDEGRDG